MLKWMSGARHNGNTTVAHYELSVNYMSLGMASKPRNSAKPDPDTTLTLLLFYNLCNTVTGRGFDCTVISVLQHTHLLVNSKLADEHLP